MFRRGEADERQDGIDPTEIRGNGSGRGSDVTVIGKGARFEGTLVAVGSLRVDGHVKGKIAAEGDVVLTGTSQVEADVVAQNVTIAGAFTGNVIARERAEIARGGRVDGNVTSKTFVVAEGARFSGQSVMDAPAQTQQPRRAAAQPPQEQAPARPEHAPTA